MENLLQEKDCTYHEQLLQINRLKEELMSKEERQSQEENTEGLKSLINTQLLRYIA